MSDKELQILLSELRSLPNETEWLEFKLNNAEELGEYISALSNSACLHDKAYGYIVFGIDDKTHRVIGTNFNSDRKGKGNEDLIPWISRLLDPKIHFNVFNLQHEDGKVVIFRIKATSNTPVSFQGNSYIRIGSYKKMLQTIPRKKGLSGQKHLQ